MNYYFAYGSNMDEKQMLKRCPNAKYYGKGYLQDYKISFTRYSNRQKSAAADILVSPGDVVWGLIYILTDEDLAQLDVNEGTPRLYRRITESIQLYKGSEVEFRTSIDGTTSAMIIDRNYHETDFKPLNVQVYEVVTKDLNLTPKIEYLQKMLDAAFEYSFPIEYQKLLYKFGQKDYNHKIEIAIDAFLEYQRLIETSAYPAKIKEQEEWGGAELVITGKIERKEYLNKNYPEDLVVLTPHWRELSWLVETLYGDEKISWQVDAGNKYYVLNQIGEAALQYQQEKPNDQSPIGICLAVLYRTYKVFTSDFYKMY